MPSSSVAQNSASVSSIARRSTARLSAPISATEVVDPENSVGGLVQLLEARFRLCEERRRCSQLGDPLLEQRERGVELQLFVLETRGNRLQAFHARLEAHGAAPAGCSGPLELPA